MTGKNRIAGIAKKLGGLTLKIAATGCNCGGICECGECGSCENPSRVEPDSAKGVSHVENR